MLSATLIRLSGSASRKSSSMPFAMSLSIFLRRESTCSSVSADMFSEKRDMITSILPSTSDCRASTPVSGGSSTSFSCGYCDSHVKSAPRSTIPMRISKIVMASPGLAPAEAYKTACSLSVVVELKPYSMPPRTPSSLGT